MDHILYRYAVGKVLLDIFDLFTHQFLNQPEVPNYVYILLFMLTQMHSIRKTYLCCALNHLLMKFDLFIINQL